MLSVLTGVFMPIHTIGQIYLGDQLARFGLPKGSIPASCLQEMADESIDTARDIAASSNRSWRTVMMEHLRADAVDICRILDGTFDTDSASEAYAAPIRRMLDKYGVPYGAGFETDSLHPAAWFGARVSTSGLWQKGFFRNQFKAGSIIRAARMGSSRIWNAL